MTIVGNQICVNINMQEKRRNENQNGVSNIRNRERSINSLEKGHLWRTQIRIGYWRYHDFTVEWGGGGQRGRREMRRRVEKRGEARLVTVVHITYFMRTRRWQVRLWSGRLVQLICRAMARGAGTNVDAVCHAPILTRTHARTHTHTHTMHSTKNLLLFKNVIWKIFKCFSSMYLFK